MAEAKLEDLIAVKNRLSGSLLAIAPGAAPPVAIGRPLRVDDAVAMAGRNVHAVGVGPKIVAGKYTDQLCIRIYVTHKLADGLLAPVFRLPKALDGLPTDVIESPPSYLLAGKRGHKRGGGRATGGRPRATARRPRKPRRRPSPTAITLEALNLPPVGPVHPCGPPNGTHRPVFAGAGAANARILSGTVGAFCRSLRPDDDPEGVYLLSNYHVLGSLPGSAPSTTAIYQPPRGDGGVSHNVIADLTRGTPINLGSHSMVDAAVAKLRTGIAFEPSICGIGRITQTARAAESIAVRKYGRGSGLTTGVVTDIAHDAIVGVSEGNSETIFLDDQIRIDAAAGDPPFAVNGDSGSIVVRADSEIAVGLLCGGDVRNGRWGVANHIDQVLAALSVQLF